MNWWEDIVEGQVNQGYTLSLQPASKAPVVANRFWAKLENAQAYVNDYESSAIPGLILSVYGDTEANNGIWWVKKVATSEGEKGELIRPFATGGGGVTSIDFSLGSDNTNAISLTINDETANITVNQLRSSLGLQSFAYDGITASDLSNVLKNGAGISYSNGIISLAEVSGLTEGTYTKVTVDKYGRVTGGQAKISVSDISDFTTTLDSKLGEYVKIKDYESDINDGTNGLATRIAKLESWFSYDENNDAIKTTFNFYSTQQIAAGGRAAITSGNLVSVVPKYNNGTLVATVNNVDIYIPATTSTGGGGGENDFWYESDGLLYTDYDTQFGGDVQFAGYLQCGAINTWNIQTYDENTNGFVSGNAGQALMSNGQGSVYWGDVSGGSVTIDALSTAFASGQLTKAITFKADDTIGILPATNNYCTIGSASKYFYKAYSSYVYTNNLYIGNTSAYFSSKTTAISASSTDYQIPSAKAVYDYCSQINRNYWYDEDQATLCTDYDEVVVNDMFINGICRFNELSIPTSSGGSTYGAGSSGQVLMSNGTTVYWGTVSGGSSYTLPLASSSARGGIKIGASSSSITGQYVDLAVALNSSEQAYVRLPKSAIVNALGFTPSSGGSDAGANPIITFSSISATSTTVPNGVSTVIVTANAIAAFKNVKPEDTSKTCIIHIIKAGSYTLSIPVASTSGIAITNSSGALATTGVALAGYAGCTLVWNSSTNNWHTKIG